MTASNKAGRWPAKIGPWLKHAETQIYESPWIRVTHEEVTTPTGTAGIYGKVSFKHRALGVIALDEEGCTWLVGQHRYALDEWSWEIPEGGGRFDETPLQGIQREFEEETGLQAACWYPLMNLRTSNCATDERAWLFVATGISASPRGARPDDTERLEIRRLKLADAIAMVMNNEITDSLSVAGLLKLKLLLGDELSARRVRKVLAATDED